MWLEKAPMVFLIVAAFTFIIGLNLFALLSAQVRLYYARLPFWLSSLTDTAARLRFLCHNCLYGLTFIPNHNGHVVVRP